jgi:hypothetical protein
MLSKYSLDMTKTVFPMFQTQYILDFSPSSRIAEHWDLPNTEISSLKMSLLYCIEECRKCKYILCLSQGKCNFLYPPVNYFFCLRKKNPYQQIFRALFKIFLHTGSTKEYRWSMKYKLKGHWREKSVWIVYFVKLQMHWISHFFFFNKKKFNSTT